MRFRQREAGEAGEAAGREETPARPSAVCKPCGQAPPRPVAAFDATAAQRRVERLLGSQGLLATPGAAPEESVRVGAVLQGEPRLLALCFVRGGDREVRPLLRLLGSLLRQRSDVRGILVPVGADAAQLRECHELCPSAFSLPPPAATSEQISLDYGGRRTRLLLLWARGLLNARFRDN